MKISSIVLISACVISVVAIIINLKYYNVTPGMGRPFVMFFKAITLTIGLFGFLAYFSMRVNHPGTITSITTNNGTIYEVQNNNESDNSIVGIYPNTSRWDRGYFIERQNGTTEFIQEENVKSKEVEGEW